MASSKVPTGANASLVCVGHSVAKEQNMPSLYAMRIFSGISVKLINSLCEAINDYLIKWPMSPHRIFLLSLSDQSTTRSARQYARHASLQKLTVWKFCPSRLVCTHTHTHTLIHKTKYTHTHTHTLHTITNNL